MAVPQDLNRVISSRAPAPLYSSPAQVKKIALNIGKIKFSFVAGL